MVESAQLSQGPRVAAFERAVAARLGRRGGAATSSGTAALSLGLGSLGVGPRDEVILPAFACSTLRDAVRFVGATEVLADVGEDLALSPEETHRWLSRRTRAIVVVHPFGHPVDVAPLLQFGLPVVEDCAQSLGATREGRPAGSFGAVAVCSFYATKMVAAGEGGMVLADEDRVLEEVRAMRIGGVHPCGFNFKLSDLAAALGLSQLRRLDAFVSRRREIAGRYDAALADTAARRPVREAGTEPCFSRYVLRVPDASILIGGLQRRGIEAKRPIGDPLLRQEAGSYPEAARAFDECVSLPVYPSLEDGDVVRIGEAVREVLREVGWEK